MGGWVGGGLPYTEDDDAKEESDVYSSPGVGHLGGWVGGWVVDKMGWVGWLV